MEFRFIPLSNSKDFAKVDKELRWLNHWNWHLTNGYACRSTTKGGTNKINLNMHVAVMEYVLERSLKHSEIVDHISGNRLDNRVSNLRIVTPKENSQNILRPHITRTSTVIDDLFLAMSSLADKELTFREGAALLDITKARLLQLKPELEEDSRFCILPDQFHRTKLVIKLTKTA